MTLTWDRSTDHDTAGSTHLTHDLPCRGCGHAAHTYLACSDSCGCTPSPLPGTSVFA